MIYTKDLNKARENLKVKMAKQRMKRNKQRL